MVRAPPVVYTALTAATQEEFRGRIGGPLGLPTTEPGSSRAAGGARGVGGDYSTSVLPTGPNARWPLPVRPDGLNGLGHSGLEDRRPSLGFKGHGVRRVPRTRQSSVRPANDRGPAPTSRPGGRRSSACSARWQAAGLLRPVLPAALAAHVVIGCGDPGLSRLALLLERLRGVLLGAALATLPVEGVGAASLRGVLADPAVLVGLSVMVPPLRRLRRYGERPAWT